MLKLTLPASMGIQSMARLFGNHSFDRSLSYERGGPSTLMLRVEATVRNFTILCKIVSPILVEVVLVFLTLLSEGHTLFDN